MPDIVKCWKIGKHHVTNSVGGQSIEALLKIKIAWINKEAGLPRWHGLCEGEKCQLVMNDFPDEALYTRTWRNYRLDLDDAPVISSLPRH